MMFWLMVVFAVAWVLYLKLWLDGKAPWFLWPLFLAAFLASAVGAILEPVTL